LQKMETGRVMPDKFTHGTSAQRTYWFKIEYRFILTSGDRMSLGLVVKSRLTATRAEEHK